MCDVPECRSEKTCDPCLVEGKEEEAKHFCVHCLEYFCLTCAQYHRKYKQSRAHVILDDLPEDTSIYERVLKFSHCLFHPEIEIDRFCKQHDKMFCRSCSDIHASCEHVVNIEECQKGNIDDIPDKLTALKSMYSTQKKELERQLEELRVNSLEVKNNIREYVQQIREVADKVEQSLNEHHQSLVSPSYAIIKQGIENVEEKEVKLNECKIFHDIMPNISSTKDQYVLVCKLNQLINDSALQPDRASLYARLISPSHTKELIAELFKCEVKLLSNEELTQEKSSDEDTCPADNNNVLFNADGMMTDKRENNDVLENRTATYREDESTATLKEGESTAKLREGESTATLREGESTVTFREGESTATFREGESTATCREVEEQSICLQNDGPVKDLDNQLNVNDDSPFLKMILGPKDKIFNIRRTDIAERGVCNIVQLDVLSDGRVILIDNGLIVLKLFLKKVLNSRSIINHIVSDQELP